MPKTDTYTIPDDARVAILVAMMAHRQTMKQNQADAEKSGDSETAAFWKYELERLREGFRALKGELL